MTAPTIRLKDVEKIYPMGGETIVALNRVNLSIDQGEFVAIMGTSGSGKSTLMHILGLLDSLSSGAYDLDGEDVSTLDSNQRAAIRNLKMGFIFQSFNLLSRQTAMENVELPMLYRRPAMFDRTRYAMEALKMVGLEERAFHKPNELSGGQQQRVAIARSLVNQPSILLADEPTGNLDTKTSEDIMELLIKLNASGITIIMVTHDSEIGKTAKRKLVMKDGNIISDD